MQYHDRPARRAGRDGRSRTIRRTACQGIQASLYEALSYGIGDAVIGINPVIDSADSVKDILLATKEVMDQVEHPDAELRARPYHDADAGDSARRRSGGSGVPEPRGNREGQRGFGINIALLDEADELIRREGTATGPNFWYFETGQGSELSSERITASIR